MISLAAQNNHTAKLFGIMQQVPSSAANTTLALNTDANDGDKQRRAHSKQPPTCITPFKFVAKWLKITQDLIDEFMSKTSKDKIRKCLNSNKKSKSAYLQAQRYAKLLNSLLAALNDLTRNNSWPMIRRSWSSISYAILNQSGLTAAQTSAPLGTTPALGAASSNGKSN